MYQGRAGSLSMAPRIWVGQIQKRLASYGEALW